MLFRSAYAARQAEKIAALPAPSIRAAKMLLKGGKKALDQKATFERMAEEAELFQEMLAGPAAREAMSAFLEKRKPDFSSIE